MRIYPGTFAGTIGKKILSYLESIIDGIHVGATGGHFAVTRTHACTHGISGNEAQERKIDLRRREAQLLANVI